MFLELRKCNFGKFLEELWCFESRPPLASEELIEGFGMNLNA